MPRVASAFGSSWMRYRVLLRSVDLHLRDAADRRDALGQIVLGVVVDERQGLRLRRECQQSGSRIRPG
jgi:hypothetical protein